jgi:D-arabinose 1-dehydrogenase-like Zn-dependent alcohol dehydrogenase
VDVDWDAYISTLRPGGKLHIVGAAPQVKATVFPLIAGEKSLGGSPIGGPGEILMMLDFCSRHAIEPTIDSFQFHALMMQWHTLNQAKHVIEWSCVTIFNFSRNV